MKNPVCSMDITGPFGKRIIIASGEGNALRMLNKMPEQILAGILALEINNDRRAIIILRIIAGELA